MKNNILIAYYSHSGNTKSVAKKISTTCGGKIVEIIPLNPYPSGYADLIAQSKEEIKSGFKPDIENTSINIDDYNIIFVGTPNWCSTIAPPIATFLTKYDFTDKIIIPFITHGGGGLGRTESEIKRLVPNSLVKEIFGIYGKNIKDNDLKSWLESVGIKINN